MFNKKLIESASVVVLAAVLTVSGVASHNLSGTNVVAEETSTEDVTNEDSSLVAGVSAALNTESDAVTVEEEVVDEVTASEDTTAVADTEATEEYTEEEQEWLNYLMPTVEDALNVRADAAEDADVVGKLHAGDVATVVEQGDTWTKITSGNVEGYVLNSYCVFGLDALAYAQENVDTIATVQTDGLRIHSEMTTDGSVVDAVSTGYELTVDKSVETSEDWVAVKYNDATAYVAAEYVTLSYDLGTASTLEEEYAAALAAQKEAEEKAAAEAAKKAAAGQKDGAGKQQKSPVGTTDDLTLLAALVMCEAGNCSYDGQLAVASVVCNRVRSGSYPSTVYAVIYQSGQFGPASSGKLARTISSGNISSSCYTAAQAALAGTDNTNGAIGFAYASSGKTGVVYGNVVFFK